MVESLKFLAAPLLSRALDVISAGASTDGPFGVLELLAGLLVLAIFCQWIAWRVKIPAILPLLAAGFLVGPVLGLLNPQELLGDLFFPEVSLLVAVILFEGALTLRWQEVRQVASTVRNLITLGAVITWVGGTLAAFYLVGLSWEISLLFGALIVVTGPTVIAPLLRNVRPTAQVASVLKWEGILIDPLGALMAVLIFDFIVAEGGPGDLGLSAFVVFLQIILIGSATGLVGGFAVAQILKRYLVPDYLRDVTILALVMGVFAFSDHFQTESGLLAVTVMGVFLANSNLHQLREVWYFKEKLSVLFISGLFIQLAANISLDDLALLDWRAFVLLIVVMFVLRPLGVQLSSLGSMLNRNERLFLSWIAPRGIVAAAVSSLFAFRLVELGYEEARILEPLVFLIIVGTVLLQGGTAKYVARWLGIAEADPQGFLLVGAHDFARRLAMALQKAGFVVRLVDTNLAHVFDARMAGLGVYHGNILSEFTENNIDLSGIGRMLALTSNDEANSLACIHLQEHFDSAEVYQLPPHSLRSNTISSHSRERLARLLFQPELTYETVDSMLARGCDLKVTKLTQAFTYADFAVEYAEGFVPLLAFQGKEVVVATIDQEFAPQPGWTLVSLTPAEAGAGQPALAETALMDVADANA